MTTSLMEKGLYVLMVSRSMVSLLVADTTDQEVEDVVETITVRVVVGGVEDEDLEKDEDTNGNKTEGTDLGEDLL